jgi:WD40 repeat protein
VGVDPQSTFLYSIHQPGREFFYRLWDINNGDEIPFAISGPPSIPEAITEIKPDGSIVASKGEDNQLVLWDVIKRELIDIPLAQRTSITAVKFSPDNQHLAISDTDNNIHLVDLLVQNEIVTLQGHEEKIMGLVYNSEGDWLASASVNEENRSIGTVLIWDTQTHQQLAKFDHATAHWFSFWTDDAILISGDQNRRIRKWNVDTGEEISYITLEGDIEKTVSMKFSPNLEVVAAYEVDTATVRLWNANSGAELTNFSANTSLLGIEHIRDFGFSQDGKLIAIAAGGDNLADGSVQLWGVLSSK